MAPPDVSAWKGLELGEPLAGGVRNPVYAARRGGQRLVVRLSARSREALDWEFALLAALSAAGLGVPVAVATDDGRDRDGGVMVHRFVPGGPPRDRTDWDRVVATLVEVHRATTRWPQRPGFASAATLMEGGRGGDVDLSALSPEAVTLVRTAWRPVLGVPTCAVHGDLGPGNVLIDGDRVTLIDWDEARVDAPAFDYAHLPPEVAIPVEVPRSAVVTAGVAWEAATCWSVEPAYAARRLAELRDRLGR